MSAFYTRKHRSSFEAMESRAMLAGNALTNLLGNLAAQANIGANANANATLHSAIANLSSATNISTSVNAGNGSAGANVGIGSQNDLNLNGLGSVVSGLANAANHLDLGSVVSGLAHDLNSAVNMGGAGAAVNVGANGSVGSISAGTSGSVGANGDGAVYVTVNSVSVPAVNHVLDGIFGMLGSAGGSLTGNVGVSGNLNSGSNVTATLNASNLLGLGSADASLNLSTSGIGARSFCFGKRWR